MVRSVPDESPSIPFAKRWARRSPGRLGAPMAPTLTMTDRLCHDCGRLLAAGEGWLVSLDFPGRDPLLATLDKIPICDRCLLTRCGRRTKPPESRVA